MNAVAEVIDAVPAEAQAIKAVPVKASIALVTLAEWIRRAHTDANLHAQQAVRLAATAGEHLAVAKQRRAAEVQP